MRPIERFAGIDDLFARMGLTVVVHPRPNAIGICPAQRIVTLVTTLIPNAG
jgi:hypothetical protein